MRDALLNSVLNDVPLIGSAFVQTVEGLEQIAYIATPLIRKFDTLLKLNHKVHAKHYDMLIAEAAA